MATKRLDRALAKINDHKSLLVIAHRGDWSDYHIIAYTGKLIRVKSLNEYTGKMCRCDSDGQIKLTSPEPLCVLWRCTISQYVLSPQPGIAVNIPLMPLRCCRSGDKLLSIDGANNSSNLLSEIATELFELDSAVTYADVDNPQLIFSTSDCSDILPTLTAKRHAMPRVFEVLRRHFELPSMIKEDKPLNYSQLDYISH